MTNLNKEIFRDLKQLKEIDLSRNKIGQLDSEIFCGLFNLEKIYLHGNQFSPDLSIEICLEKNVNFFSYKSDYEHNDLKSVVIGK